MLLVALGFRMHSGWGVMVALDQHCSVLERKRLVVATDEMPGGRQPYHHARDLGLQAAEGFLKEYVATCNCSAETAVREVAFSLKKSGYRVVGAGLTLAADRDLPELARILAAHPLIHTAEGRLFRDVIRHSCEVAGIPVLGIRERELSACLRQSLGALAEQTEQTIGNVGTILGPPWNLDHKSAAMAACLALHEFGVGFRVRSSGV